MILVTGATGILGRVIVLELLKRGKTVRAAKRPTSNLDEVRHSYQFYTENPDVYFDKINWVELDFEDKDSLISALEGISEVYHCAAKVSFHPDDNSEMLKCNINFTENLLYACENSGVKKFLFVSSIAVLDNVNEKGILDEDSNFNPKENHSDYALSKHFAEMEVWRASAEGLNTIIINPGVIVGSANWKNSSGKLFKELTDNQFSFSGGTSYVDVRDVVKISIDLMEKNVFGQRFIVISETKSYEETANFLRQKVNKSNVKILPMWILKIGVFLNFLFGWLFKPLKMVNSVNIKSVSYQSEISNEKIIKELNFNFIPVFESLDFHFKNYLKDHTSV
ncbi:NAD-dependent epimerase/dehydratase family protein [Halpernia frigidisoli]|uniref:Nucleoside-diphosphate-sugar epimerase n=1 Tax=Halpernia frigidisoli TaxID=1125876 RepID=A0A1I3FFX4_9FLAO|nr:NAD-dependent epimerase/dehydratase family protein [Halpernia frigidisoli]SFI10090.1 Nucleoside-diphosphate-sugar epimerase [Halpernia frigidisoli]